jgi:hypothetical protein
MGRPTPRPGVSQRRPTSTRSADQAAGAGMVGADARMTREVQDMARDMGMRFRAAALAVVVGIVTLMAVIAVTPAAAAATELPHDATWNPLYGVGTPSQTPVEHAAQARQSAGPPGLVRQLARVLPSLRRMPIGTTVERVPPGNGEACPGVRARGPRAAATVVRSFEIPGNEFLFVQVVAFERPRQAQRALETWFRQSTRDCRRFSIDEFTFVSRRTRPPFFGIGDSRAAFRTRVTFDDPTFGRLHAAERVTVAYRDRRYLLLASSTGVLEFLGDTPKPNFGRWADSIEFMWDRAGALPR